MRKSNIGIDLDGVICDLYKPIYPLLGVLAGIDLKNATKEQLEGNWEKEFGLSQEKIRNIFVEAGKRGIYRDAPVYAETRSHLVNISRQYNIFYVTIRDFYHQIKKDTFYWLDKNKLPYFRVVFTRSKHKIADRENLQFFVDDDANICNRVAKTKTPTFLFRRPWNQSAILDPLVKITDSWADIEDMLLVEKT